MNETFCQFQNHQSLQGGTNEKRKKEYYFQYRGNRNGSCSRERHKQEQVTSTPIAIGNSSLDDSKIDFAISTRESARASIERCACISPRGSRSQDFDEDRDYGIRIESSGVKSLFVLETTGPFPGRSRNRGKPRLQ